MIKSVAVSTSTAAVAARTDATPPGLIAKDGWVAPRIGEPGGKNGKLVWSDDSVELATQLPPLVPFVNDADIVIGYVSSDYYLGVKQWIDLPLVDENGTTIGHIDGSGRPVVDGE